jgi:hypothetical protein
MKGVLLGVVAILLGAAIWADAYEFVPLPRLAASPGRYAGKRVLTTGVFHPRASLAFSVDGWLEADGVRIRVVGPLFDWRPQPAQRVDMWGLFRQDSGDDKFFLDFFNGRKAGDPKRAPRLTPALVPGRTVWLVGRLRQTGSAPFVRWVVVLEDRTQVDLLNFPPPGVTLTAGRLVEIEGRVEGGAFPPSAGAIVVLKVREIPGLQPPPF